MWLLFLVRRDRQDKRFKAHRGIKYLGGDLAVLWVSCWRDTCGCPGVGAPGALISGGCCSGRAVACFWTAGVTREAQAFRCLPSERFGGYGLLQNVFSFDTLSPYSK